MSPASLLHCRCLVAGQVQGVGFRPFVYRLATEECLNGSVGNTSDGVTIHLQGPRPRVDAFLRRLRAELPPLARITDLDVAQLPPDPALTAFRIVPSHGHSGHHVLVSPDVGICPDCLHDMRQPGNARYGYAFTNCTNCGPRYTITRSIPYDRASTSMACFPLCPRCTAEYENPLDRRFHAQPVACPDCGPRLWLVERSQDAPLLPSPATACPAGQDAGAATRALQRAAALLRQGRLLALKGLGGFQLACDARQDQAVRCLRERKQRPHKALAVMLPHVEAAHRLCCLTPEHEALLTSPEKPIVLCPLRPRTTAPDALSPLLAPDTDSLGIMLPYTPLHVALFDQLDRPDGPPPALVMTSANARGEPLCLGNREALQRLGQVADAFLLHDRDILVRVDDSVVAAVPAAVSSAAPATVPATGQADTARAVASPFFYRRARGYVPRPVRLPPWQGPGQPPVVLATGAELKATLCLVREREAFVSQHLGDLENVPTGRFFEEVAAHLERLLEVRPQALVCDAHPDFFSSRWAQQRAQREGLPLFRLQHHAAHAAAVLAEHGCLEPALALCLDGTGLGDDGSIWGGELLLVELAAPRWQRLGRLAPFALPGGEAAIRQPWRLALALRARLGRDDLPPAWQDDAPLPAWTQDSPLLHARQQARSGAPIIREMLARQVNCPATSSCGRLFDAVSAELGCCLVTSYEGQAAIRLETLARQAPALPPLPPDEADGLLLPAAAHGPLPQLDSAALFARVLDDAPRLGAAAAALRFHQRLALALALLTAHAARQTGCRHVGLSGGCLQNLLLARLLPAALRRQGLSPLLQEELPPGDGGLCLGQAMWGRQLLHCRHVEQNV